MRTIIFTLRYTHEVAKEQSEIPPEITDVNPAGKVRSIASKGVWWDLEGGPRAVVVRAP